ncbi:hypothetical protein BDZ45DRAFT_743749 [Acephala macrosclerotiorum]|nr:hypothetical protein BDZ45DRAFT_743749 [Acephala macrosclerotiorum]
MSSPQQLFASSGRSNTASSTSSGWLELTCPRRDSTASSTSSSATSFLELTHSSKSIRSSVGIKSALQGDDSRRLFLLRARDQ